MDDYIVKITSQAEEQIQEIFNYITHELMAPESALRLLDGDCPKVCVNLQTDVR